MCLWVRMLAINIPKRMISRQNDMYELIIRWRWGNTYNEKNDSCNCGKEKGLGDFTFVYCNRPMRSKGVLVQGEARSRFKAKQTWMKKPKKDTSITYIREKWMEKVVLCSGGKNSLVYQLLDFVQVKWMWT